MFCLGNSAGAIVRHRFTRLVGIGMLGALAWLAPTAARADGSPIENSAEMFSRFDIDRDGQLTAQEIGPYDWTRYDVNGDGMVSREEFLRGRRADKEQAATDPDGEKAFALLDWNHDGWLSGTELDGKWHIYDRNNDGRVTKAEFIAGRAAEQHEPAPRPIAPSQTDTPQTPRPRQVPRNEPTPAAEDPAVTPPVVGAKSRAAADGWQTIDATAKGFTFDMPGQPNLDENGSYMLATDSNNTVYMVTILQGKEQLEGDADERLRLVMEAAQKLTKGRPVGEKRLNVGGHPAASFTFVTDQDIEYRYRVIIAGDRLCQMVVIRGAESQTSPASVNRFFDSLTILQASPQPNAPVIAAQPSGPTVQGEVPPGWTVTSIDGANISFATPGKPQADANGNYILLVDNGATVYKVSVAQAQQDLSSLAASKLEELRDMEVKQTKGRLINDKATELQGYKGRDFSLVIEGENETDIRIHAIIAGGRIIELIFARTPNSQTGPANIKKFFNSLTIGGGATPGSPVPSPDDPTPSDPTPSPGRIILTPPGGGRYAPATPVAPLAPAPPGAPGTPASGDGSLIGMSLDDAKQTDLFTFFKLQEAGSSAGPFEGTKVISFKPSGPRFRDYVTLRIGVSGAQRVTAVGLYLSRSFIDDANLGRFARDLAKSTLRAALTADDQKLITDSLNEIEYGHLGPDTLLANGATIPKLPDPPSIRYLAFLGKVAGAGKDFKTVHLQLENNDLDGVPTLLISVEPLPPRG
ncbi:MAG: hypothetical protein JSS27_15275 [Planctomycetes bacterium]|nr:hypothetical protein [Planctomycetota bacterium]